MASTSEELDLLERVFLRIGAAETDEQLENLINKFLIPVLLKLSSGNEGVRKKVMELLVHVNLRLKRRPTVQVPVEALLKQYTEPSATSFFINFSILYIKVGFPRLPQEKQKELAPLLVSAIVGKPQTHQDSLLLLLISIIGTLKVPTDPLKKKSFLNLDQHPTVIPKLSSFMLDVLLMPYAWVPGRDSENQVAVAPPGLSPYKMARISTPEMPMTAEVLEQTKRGILEILMNGIFPAEETVVHLLVAAADTRFSVTDLADTELNRVVRTVDWYNVSMAMKLFTIYLGTPKQQKMAENLRCLPANTRIRMKLLPYLSRLEKDAICFPFCLQVIFDTLYGENTNPKLKQLALNFALGIVRKAEELLLKKICPMLYTGMLKLVWDKDTSENLKVTAYTTIGQIVKRFPSIINRNLLELQVFFDNLSCSSQEVRSAVRDALICMVDAFKLAMSVPSPVPADGSTPMEVDTPKSHLGSKKDDKNLDDPETRDLFMSSLLAGQVEEKESMARFVAATYAATVFPPEHVTSKYLLLLSTGDSVSSVSSFAVKSLYAGHVEAEIDKEKSIKFPDFVKMVRIVHEKAAARLKNPTQRVTVANANLPFNLTVVEEMLHYLRCCLAQSAGVTITKKSLLSHPCENSPLIGRYIKQLNQSDPSVMERYLSLVDMFITPSSLLAPLQNLEEVLGCCPELFSARYVNKTSQFLGYLGNSREDIRESVSVIYANIIVSTSDDNALKSSVLTLLKDLQEKTPHQEIQHGYLLVVGLIFESKIFLSPTTASWKEFETAIRTIGMHLKEGEPLVQSAACQALSLVSRLVSLPIPDTTPENEETLSKKMLVDRLMAIIKANKSGSKVKERAIYACGSLCLTEEFPHTSDVLKGFLELSKEIKDIDLHFSIGEALISCIEGPISSLRRDAWRVTGIEYKKSELNANSCNLLKWLVTELLKLGIQPHPNIRQAVCAYLLSITKRLANVPTLRDSQPNIQIIFMEYLSENNELVQDMASKGLALLYENSSDEEKKLLVTGLLDQLLAGKRAVQQVTADTKLFEEGQLGTAPGGGNLSTYRELCSLASDLNQPDLVYKFMHLANHNAVWNSKKGAAFGFQTIASQANEHLNEYLPAVIPRLYRYQFDPTPRIQQSMANIWHSIVKDTSKTVDKYQKEILDDILLNLTSNQWRVRSSCCSAISDFFRGNRSVLDFKPKLAELWGSLFRVMDDVHEGTRLQAQNTSKILANICVRVCDAERIQPDSELIQILLNIFLKGITDAVAEVRQLCLSTVSQFVSLAGSSLKPSLTTLIPALLEAAGELESVGLSYLSAQFGGQTQAQDLIDSARASVTKSHYTTQTVTKCVQYVDIDMLDALVPKILEVMRSVNLGSRVASAHLIILLAHHLGKSMDAYTGKFLAGLVNGLLDRNATIRKTYASTIGQILHTAKESSVERLVAKLNLWYFEKEDSNTRSALGNTLQAIAHYNSELLKQQFPVVIPLVFFAKHDQKTEENKTQVEMWEEVWNEITPGTEAGIRQHLNEIVKLLKSALQSPSWNMKSQAGRCISTAAIRLDQNLNDEPRHELVTCILTALQGRTFRGKEELITALAHLITHAPPQFRETSEDCELIVDTLLREAAKTDQIYKRHSLQALGDVLDVCTNIDRFENVYTIVQEMLSKLKKPDDDGETGIEELSKQRNEKYKTLSIVYETLGKAWPQSKATQLKFEKPVLVECLQTLELSPRDVQVSILSALHYYLDKLQYWKEENKNDSDVGLNEILSQVVEALIFALGVEKHTRLRKEALNIVWLLGQKLSKTERKPALDRLVTTLKPSIQALEKDPTPEVRTRLMDLKELFATK